MTTTAQALRPATNLTTATSPRRVWRRIGAVFAGLVTIFAVTTALDAVLHAPDHWLVVSHFRDAEKPIFRSTFSWSNLIVAARSSSFAASRRVDQSDAASLGASRASTEPARIRSRGRRPPMGRCARGRVNADAARSTFLVVAYAASNLDQRTSSW